MGERHVCTCLQTFKDSSHSHVGDLARLLYVPEYPSSHTTGNTHLDTAPGETVAIPRKPKQTPTFWVLES